ncbi:MAG: GNAT family N-acetyltransferase [Anaerolineae bacterium]
MNITIRRAEPSDYEAMHRVLSGPRAIWGTLQMPYPSIEMWRKRLAEPPEGLINLVACVDGEVVGQLGLHTEPNRPRRRHVAGLGIVVRDDWQGKGIGTALMQAAVDLADKWLNLERIELEVYTDNEHAIHLYEKFGFQIEGTFIRHSFRDGKYIDTHAMGRLRPDMKGGS